MEATMNYLRDNDSDKDLDDDDMNFESAVLEETQDKIRKKHRRKGKKLNQKQVNRISKHQGVT
jgi:hypothetical protein